MHRVTYFTYLEGIQVLTKQAWIAIETWGCPKGFHIGGYCHFLFMWKNCKILLFVDGTVILISDKHVDSIE